MTVLLSRSTFVYNHKTPENNDRDEFESSSTLPICDRYETGGKEKTRLLQFDKTASLVARYSGHCPVYYSPSQSVSITSKEFIHSRICGFVKVARLIGSLIRDIAQVKGESCCSRLHWSSHACLGHTKVELCHSLQIIIYSDRTSQLVLTKLILMSSCGRAGKKVENCEISMKTLEKTRNFDEI